MHRTILDLFILLSQHVLLTFALALAFWWVLARRTGAADKLQALVVSRGRIALLLLAACLFVGFVAIAGWYLSLDGFAGEVEPVVSCLSWLVEAGHPLYHSLESAERYSVLYGPSVFLTNGLVLKILGPTICNAKLASSLAAIASLGFLYGALRRRRLDTAALGITSLSVLYFWSQGFAVYLVRPDSLLLFAVGFGLFAAARARRFLAILAIAAAMGFAVNLKLHGGIYFLPILALMWKRFGWRPVAWALVLAVLVVAAPFALHPQVSLTNYLVWVKAALSHGMLKDQYKYTVPFAIYMLLPLLVMIGGIPRRGRWLRRNGALVGTLCVALVVTLLVAAKPGAGLVHLLPLVPTCLFVAGLAARELPCEARLSTGFGRRLSGPVVAMVLTALLVGTVHCYRSVRLVAWENDDSRELACEIRDIMEQYPDLPIGMACGGEDESFRTTWLRPLLVFADNPLLLDPVAVMDCCKAGQDLPLETYQAISEGQVALWLVPRQQQPFFKQNWYSPHEIVFPEQFRAHFEANYSLRGTSEFFDLWFWNGLPVVQPVPSAVATLLAP